MNEPAVRVFEVGERPSILTKTRANAPAAAKALADILAKEEFADLWLVVVDWEDSLRQQPEEARKPILFIQGHKWLLGVEEENHLTVESRIDIDDVFGGTDFMTNSLLRDIAHDVSEKVKEALAKRSAA